MSKPLSEILRPTSFEELVMSSNIRKKLETMQKTKNVMNMLFYGKPGSGKTSAAKIFLDDEEFDSLTINGSLETGVNEVRDTIRKYANTISLWEHKKIVLIDEADYLSKNSQAGLRKVIEDTSNNCRFIFTANDLNKIHPALCSRLLLINFDVTRSQIDGSFDSYKKRVIEVVERFYPSANITRIGTIIDLNFPDYRSISNQVEFSLI